jgi:hypothetical protein
MTIKYLFFLGEADTNGIKKGLAKFALSFHFAFAEKTWHSS